MFGTSLDAGFSSRIERDPEKNRNVETCLMAGVRKQIARGLFPISGAAPRHRTRMAQLTASRLANLKDAEQSVHQNNHN